MSSFRGSGGVAGESSTGGVITVAGGFSEYGSDGVVLQERLSAAAWAANTPVIGAEMALVYTRDHLWAFAIATGGSMWDAKAAYGDAAWSLSEAQRPVSGDRNVFLCSRRNVTALKAADGSTLPVDSRSPSR